ncbi:hypothetical protein BC826DRAFT_1177460, partial [Russula brevipes]
RKRRIWLVVAKSLELLYKSQRDQLRRDFRTWLSPPSPSVNHNTACKSRHSGPVSGLLRAALAHSGNGKRTVRCCGSVAIVRFSCLFDLFNSTKTPQRVLGKVFF